MTPEQLNVVVLGVCAVLLAAVAAVRISSRSGMPSMLLYLAIGLLLGEAGIGIRFDDGQLAYNLATLMLALLLADGGFTTDWKHLRPVALRAGLLASVGVMLSVTITATLAMWILGLDLRTAILLSAIVSSTDAAATFAVLRRLPIKDKVRTQLEGESGFNDPPAIIIVSVVVSDAWNQGSVLQMVGTGLYQLVGGTLIGILIGRLGQVLLNRVSLPSSGLYPLATVSITLVAFAVGGIAGTSGLLSAYASGLWLGNQPLPHKQTTRGFTESLGWLAQIGLFVMLGLLASPASIPAAIVPALVIGGALTFIARPLAVAVILTPFRTGWREQAFTSWAGLRGAVPIMLATIPLTTGMAGATHMFHVIFVLVLFFTLLQGPTLPLAARLTGVTEELAPTEVQFDSSPLEGINASLLQFVVPHASKLVGLYVADLRLPHGAMITMVIRDKVVLVPDGKMRLRGDDHLLIAVPNGQLRATQDRLRLLSQHGQLARWVANVRRRTAPADPTR
ncbi:potassium/proton antiporter [Tessaracoccus sp. OS52]|uniref:potassium/proton antiporter n=1 Tax=Tessaracoccus sp. OS52 TaxID=2886691 RepID=UPI001D10B32C|nr:potassium/proton antiporter [Tessaracoccus sp. OS52]MCC2594603.1 potassium/proton antiporter [Tessaracoccus sp. OS52]